MIDRFLAFCICCSFEYRVFWIIRSVSLSVCLEYRFKIWIHPLVDGWFYFDGWKMLDCLYVLLVARLHSSYPTNKLFPSSNKVGAWSLKNIVWELKPLVNLGRKKRPSIYLLLEVNPHFTSWALYDPHAKKSLPTILLFDSIDQQYLAETNIDTKYVIQWSTDIKIEVTSSICGA